MRSISVPGSFDRGSQRGEVFARPNSNEPPPGFGDAPPIVSAMSNLAPSAAAARVPEGTVRLVAALTSFPGSAWSSTTGSRSPS
jgi:hypothetical protein